MAVPVHSLPEALLPYPLAELPPLIDVDAASAAADAVGAELNAACTQLVASETSAVAAARAAEAAGVDASEKRALADAMLAQAATLERQRSERAQLAVSRSARCAASGAHADTLTGVLEGAKLQADQITATANAARARLAGLQRDIGALEQRRVQLAGEATSAASVYREAVSAERAAAAALTVVGREVTAAEAVAAEARDEAEAATCRAHGDSVHREAAGGGAADLCRVGLPRHVPLEVSSPLGVSTMVSPHHVQDPALMHVYTTPSPARDSMRRHECVVDDLDAHEAVLQAALLQRRLQEAVSPVSRASRHTLSPPPPRAHGGPM